LEEGAEADFVLFDPTFQWVVDADGFQSRSRNSAYLGETLTGRVFATFRGGRLTWQDGG
jgi:dihydroorotase